MNAVRKRETRRKTAAYSVPIKVRAAFLAGEGKTPREICDELGISEPHKLRAMLRTLGIRPHGQRRVIVPAGAQLIEALGTAADRADMTPEEFAARVLTLMVVEEPTVLRNLLDAPTEGAE